MFRNILGHVGYWGPVCINVVLVYATVEFTSQQSHTYAYSYGLASIATTIGSFMYYFDRDSKKSVMFPISLVNGGLLVLVFANCYFHFGLYEPVHFLYTNEAGTQYLAELQKVSSRIDAVYFSLVTSTTLGFGDIQPFQPVRMLAALQSVAGYLFLGFIISFLSTNNNKSAKS